MLFQFAIETSENIVTLPVGAGVRYWCGEQFAIQLDITDNMVLATDSVDKIQHNVTLSLGVTFAFGGR